MDDCCKTKTLAVGPSEARHLLLLVMRVRDCTHGDEHAVKSTQPTIPGTASGWCIACGSALVDGQWLAPGWFALLDKWFQHCADQAEAMSKDRH